MKKNKQKKSLQQEESKTTQKNPHLETKQGKNSQKKQVKQEVLDPNKKFYACLQSSKYGKVTTVVIGLQDFGYNLNDLAKVLKKNLGTTVNVITDFYYDKLVVDALEFQGNVLARLPTELKLQSSQMVLLQKNGGSSKGDKMDNNQSQQTKKGQKKEFVELLTSSDDPDDKFFVRAVETHDGWTTQIIGLEVYGINLYEMAEKIQSGLIIPTQVDTDVSFQNSLVDVIQLQGDLTDGRLVAFFKKLKFSAAQIEFQSKVRLTDTPVEKQEECKISPDTRQEFQKKSKQDDDLKKPNMTTFMNTVSDLWSDILDGSLICSANPKCNLPNEPLDEFNSLQEYSEYWKSLYKFEIYNRIFSDKDLGQFAAENPQDELIIQKSQQERSSIWMGFCEAEQTYIQNCGAYKMYAKKPGQGQNEQNEQDIRKEIDKFNKEFQIRDDVNKYDLILLSSEDLNFDTKVNRLKRSRDLQDLVDKETCCLALVISTPERSKNVSKVDQQKERKGKFPYIEFIVDKSMTGFIPSLPSYNGYKKLYVYFVTSLRSEFKEFELLSLTSIQSMNIFDRILNKSNQNQKIQHRPIHSAFIESVKSRFNEEQIEVLNSVACMPEFDIKTMWGPPGTGKTQVLNSIISMAWRTNQKVHICAPSNAAIDEILTRINASGLIGLHHFRDSISKEFANEKFTHNIDAAPFEMKGENQYKPQGQFQDVLLKDIILRLGAEEYAAPDHLRDYSFNERVQMILRNARLKFIEPYQKLSKELTIKVKKQQNLINFKSHFKIEEPNDWDLATNNGFPIEDIEWLDNEFKKITNKDVAKKLEVNAVFEKLMKDGIKFTEEDWNNALAATDQLILSLKKEKELEAAIFIDNRLKELIVRLKRGEEYIPEPKNEEEKWNLRKKVVGSAKVILTTVQLGLSFANNIFKPDFVLIDEACQCTEPEVLIALKTNPKFTIMMGDHKQLPPTVFSPNGNQTKFARSLFQRLRDGNYQQEELMLKKQYRMHKKICEFPSLTFYDGQISNGVRKQEHVESQMIKGDQFEYQNFYGQLVMKKFKQINPLVFLDLTKSKEHKQHLSWTNHSEIDLIMNLISHLIWLAGNDSPLLKQNIGIITPYRGQVRAIKRRWQDYHQQFNLALNDIRIDTVDSFQGQECEIIIYSCVRKNDHGNLGFLTDNRRLNVSLTRAKNFLFIIGDTKTLKHDPTWNELIDHCRSQKSLPGMFQLTYPQDVQKLWQ